MGRSHHETAAGPDTSELREALVPGLWRAGGRVNTDVVWKWCFLITYGLSISGAAYAFMHR